MINTLRMDFRRLFKTRGFYLACLWALGIMAIMATASWFLADEFVREAGSLAGFSGGQIAQEARKLFNVSRFASFFMGAPSFMHLFLVVFAAGYISRDHQSGYFKNLLALPGAREKWLVGKQAAALAAGALFYGVVILGSVVVTLLFGNTPRIDVPQLAAFFGLHLSADLALFALLTLATALFQTRTAAVMVGMVFAFNMQALIYLLIDQIGFLPFALSEYGMVGLAGRLDIFTFGQAQPDLLSSMMMGRGGFSNIAPTTPGQLLPVSLGLWAVLTFLSWITLRYRDYRG